MLTSDFDKAAKVAREMDTHTFLDAILKERPDIGEKVRNGAVKPQFPGLGYSAYTVILGDEVFKTSQYDAWPGVEPKDLILGIMRERNILAHLTGKKLPMPELTYVGREFSFFGMKRLPGEVLTRSDVECLDSAEKRKLAKEIAEFCAGLANAVSSEDAKRMALDASPAEKMFDGRQLRADLEDDKVRKALGGNYALFKQAVENYIAFHDEEPTASKKHLMHCDLKEGNMLWDRKAKKLSGVIDFGLSHMAGLESGFKKLYEKYPADFADQIMEEYCKIQSVRMTPQQVKTWACAEYVAYVVSELKADKDPMHLRSYDSYVKAPLRIKSLPPVVAKAAAVSTGIVKKGLKAVGLG